MTFTATQEEQQEQQRQWQKKQQCRRWRHREVKFQKVEQSFGPVNRWFQQFLTLPQEKTGKIPITVSMHICDCSLYKHTHAHTRAHTYTRTHARAQTLHSGEEHAGMIFLPLNICFCFFFISSKFFCGANTPHENRIGEKERWQRGEKKWESCKRTDEIFF